MVEISRYAHTQLADPRPAGRATAAPGRLLWAQGALLGLALAAAVVASAFVAARALLAAPAAVRVRVSITEVMAEAVTGYFGARERVVVIYTLREIGAGRQPASGVEGRAVFNLSAGARAYDLRPLAIDAAPGSAVRLEARLFALDPVYGDLRLLEADAAAAVAGGHAALVGCVTHTLLAAHLDIIQRRGSGPRYNRMLPGECTAGAARPLAASPYRVSYSVEVDSAR